MKIALVISYVLIGVVVFIVIMQWRTIANLNMSIEKVKAAIPSVKALTEANDPNKLAGDWIEKLQSAVKEMDVKFVTK